MVIVTAFYKCYEYHSECNCYFFMKYLFHVKVMFDVNGTLNDCYIRKTRFLLQKFLCSVTHLAEQDNQEARD